MANIAFNSPKFAEWETIVTNWYKCEEPMNIGEGSLTVGFTFAEEVTNHSKLKKAWSKTTSEFASKWLNFSGKFLVAN